MKIPTGVDYITFYKKAKAKGIYIESKYNGVHAIEGNKRVSWIANVYYKGENATKRFPFTELGERQAHQWRERKLNELKLKADQCTSKQTS